jgi:secreted trypsin-like serine protease
VRLGTLDIGAGGGTEWRIDAVVRASDNLEHPELGNDIALLHIVAARPETRLAPASADRLFPPRTIRLAVKGDPAMESGEALEMTGWGVTGVAEKTRQARAQSGAAQVPAEVMQLARLQYWDQENCNHDARFRARGYQLKPDQICAGSTGTDSACFMDSGGPLVWRRPRTGNPREVSGPVLIGLVSFGIGCGMRNAPSGFVDVRAFERWIDRALKHYLPGHILTLP